MPKQPRMPNMQQMMAQVQKMQKDMELAQEQLKHEVVEASAGGGMVTVKVSGALEVREVKIDPSAVDPEDVEILADERGAADGAVAGGEQAGRRDGGPGPGRPWRRLGLAGPVRP
jgi:DNA-binding YbaB/EbfC family protein